MRLFFQHTNLSKHMHVCAGYYNIYPDGYKVKDKKKCVDVVNRRETGSASQYDMSFGINRLWYMCRYICTASRATRHDLTYIHAFLSSTHEGIYKKK